MECLTYIFKTDASAPKLSTGRMLGKAVLVDNHQPPFLFCLAEVDKKPYPIRLMLKLATNTLRAEENNGYFSYYTDEETKTLHCLTEVRLLTSQHELKFLSPPAWSIKFHRSVYDPEVEFHSINKSIYTPDAK